MGWMGRTRRDPRPNRVSLPRCYYGKPIKSPRNPADSVQGDSRCLLFPEDRGGRNRFHAVTIEGT